MNFETAIDIANKELKKNKIKSSMLDCEILMSKVMNNSREFIILNSKKKIKKNNYNHFKKLVYERLKGKPIAYITGKKYFWKYEFEINEDVLIPRPDTEIIIEQVLNIFKNKSRINFLDIGIGSGCILLSILKEKKNYLGTGIDMSNECVKLSKINAIKLGVNNRVKIIKSNVDNFNFGKYDLIISNPPYIKKLDLKYLDRDVINFEPRLALDGGLEGLSEIRKVIAKSSELIKKKGKLILEIAFDQKNEVKKLLKDKGFYIDNIVKDFAKNDRCIISTKI
ncbi:peptide chain release factor N(5)-glutamine methyltransferase [Candidatus Pelagibacter sp.]|nr:peptide chain release factor N(5)-glutamine methyltransferase [Candidatus Pelagibacter sp.]